jgi:tRNA uridine 5-carboxymethylaminomethyl modification enzyme
MAKVERKIRHSEELVAFAKNLSVNPEEINEHLLANDTEPMSQKQKLGLLLLRPQLSLNDKLIDCIPALRKHIDSIDETATFRNEIIEQVEILLKYEGYVDKESAFVDKMNKLESVSLKDDFDYASLPSFPWKRVKSFQKSDLPVWARLPE